MNEENATPKNSGPAAFAGYVIDSIIIMAIGVIGLGMITWRF